LNGASMIYYLVTQPHPWNLSKSALTAIALLSTIVTSYLLIQGKKIWLTFFYVSAVAILLFWIVNGYWWIGLLMLLLFLLFKVSDRQLIVTVSNSNLEYPSFPKRNIQWKDLSNLVLKDGLLTIDFKNNRIIQQYIGTESKPINEKEFNEFCREQLDK
jgi:hypothetical protein